MSVFEMTYKGGNLINLIAEKLVDKKLPQPYNKCLKNLNTRGAFSSDLFEATLDYSYTYRQINCYDLCMQLYISDICQCSILTGSCDNFTACTSKEYNRFDTAISCEKNCPLECDQITYDVTKEILPSKSALKQKNIEKIKNIGNNVTGLSDKQIVDR